MIGFLCTWHYSARALAGWQAADHVLGAKNRVMAIGPWMCVSAWGDQNQSISSAERRRSLIGSVVAADPLGHRPGRDLLRNVQPKNSRGPATFSSARRVLNSCR